MRAVAGGDRAGLACLYDRHGPTLLAIGHRMLGSRREAEDLLHDVFLEVWRQSGDYDRARGSVRTWMTMRMRSRALDRLKSAAWSRVGSLDAMTASDLPHAAGEDPTLSADRGRVRRALGALPAEQRAVLELAYFGGLSSNEMAERLGVPIGTGKSRVAAGLSKLRADLDPPGGGP